MRRLLLLLAVSLAASGCHQRARRTAGDEVPYPAIDEASLDRDAAPCQDFYQFACGSWVVDTPVPPDRTRWVRGGGEVEERNARLLRRILEEAGAGKVDAQDRFGRKAGDFYAACMDEGDVEASGLAELQAEWARLDAVSDRLELADELSRLESMGLRATLGVRAEDPDPAGTTRPLLVIGREGVGLPGRQPEPRPGSSGGTEAEVEHVRTMLRLGGVPAGQVEREAAAAVGLERSLEGVPPAAEQPAAPARLDRAAVLRLAPRFPWDRFFRAIGAERLDVVGVADAGFVARLGQTFDQAPVETWRAYLRVRLVEAMAAERALPAPMVQEWFRFQRTLAPAPAELRPRWKHCVDVTARTFAFPTGRAFARKHLASSGRQRAGWLVSELQRGMLVTIESAPWIDAATQSRAAAKLDRMVAQIGTPESGPDYKSLRASRDSYFRNLLSAGRFAVAQEVAHASRPVDRSEWLAGPFTAAAAYSPARNVLCVPAGALQPPTYNAQAPDPVVFGSMGAVIGARLAEALQGEGRHRGPDGGLGDWWTPAAARDFEVRAACLVNQYDVYEVVGGQRLDGRRTLAANLTDLAGLRAAYEAMQAERTANPTPEKKVLGFTSEQQFFVAYAQTLCTTATEEDVAEQAARGASPPARFRVNGPLSNLPEFAKAFRCGAGDPMVRPPAARCDVW